MDIYFGRHNLIIQIIYLLGLLKRGLPFLFKFAIRENEIKKHRCSASSDDLFSLMKETDRHQAKQADGGK